MFDWQRAIGQSQSDNYYKECFKAGFISIDDRTIEFKRYQNDTEFLRNSKSEVSMGSSTIVSPIISNFLANKTTKHVPEIFAEEGFSYNNIDLNKYSALEPIHLKSYNNDLIAPYRNYIEFKNFYTIFNKYGKTYLGLNNTQLNKKLEEMDISNYLENIPENILAKSTEDYDFICPFFIIESLCFLDESILPSFRR